MSNLKSLIADDLDSYEDKETQTVTHRPRRNNADGTDQTCANVRRLMLRRSEQAFAGIRLTDQAVRFILKENEVTAVASTEIVKAGDLLLIGTVATPSEAWKVARCSLETFDTQWVCDCSRVDGKN